MRVLIAGIVGGIVMFMWGFVAHMMLGIGDGGMHTIKDEAPVLAAMRSSMPQSGIYLLPGIDMTRAPTDEEWAALTQKAAAGPTAFVVFSAEGSDLMSSKQLLTELGADILTAIVAAFMASMVAASFGKRVLFITLIGLAAWLSIEASFWNWYRFPTAFVIDELIDQVVGFLFTGLAIAFILRPRSA